MARDRKGLRAVMREIAESADRSPLFWWMVRHHDELVTAAQGRRMRWATLCLRFAELGLKDAQGNPATTRTARETWKRARKAVAEGKRRQAEQPPRPGAVFPSRLPKDWYPPTAPQPVRVGGRAVAPQASTSRPASQRPPPPPAGSLPSPL
ncbi:MAG TPA: hypothetical protein VJ739_07330, partial [Gemmataceae bacterium]|nr:hypothetical protein [Gemmataceae bacterium]